MGNASNFKLEKKLAGGAGGTALALGTEEDSVFTFGYTSSEKDADDEDVASEGKVVLTVDTDGAGSAGAPTPYDGLVGDGYTAMVKKCKEAKAAEQEAEAKAVAEKAGGAVLAAFNAAEFKYTAQEGNKWCSPKASFELQSDNMNGFAKGKYAAGRLVGVNDGMIAMSDIHDVPPAIGAILGFAVFAVLFIGVVIMIFIDMNKRKDMYQEMIEEDLAKIDAMGLGHKMAEYERDLKIRLQGKKTDEGVDDQLVT